MPYSFTLNGQQAASEAPGLTPLVAVLRDELGLRGAKLGCGEGRCGACTVLLDGRPTRSCVTPVRAAAGRQVRTIEGLATGDRLHPLQEAFLREDALQCGYCTPGIASAFDVSIATMRAAGTAERRILPVSAPGSV